ITEDLLDELHLSVNNCWHAQYDRKYPEDGADDLGIECPSQPPGLHGLHKCQVAVNTNHGQGISVRPVKVIEDVHGPEREATQENKVSKRQAAQVDLCYGQSILVSEEHRQDKAVKEKA
uniref:Uncharacterized protein n=1 Tax=Cyclopterus lumpus TaxID=8103 RepID=A0A8C3ARD2_CYCLU